MKYRRRIQYTETDKALMWERWRQGESLHAIARLFERTILRSAAFCREPVAFAPRHDVARTWR